MIKVKISFHVIIIITLSVRLGSDENTSPDYPVKPILQEYNKSFYESILPIDIENMLRLFFYNYGAVFFDTIYIGCDGCFSGFFSSDRSVLGYGGDTVFTGGPDRQETVGSSGNDACGLSRL